MKLPVLKATLKRHFARGGFARQVTMVTGGTAVSQILAVLIGPILTRLYAPGDFGILQFYSSLLFPLIIIACWRYEQAIPLPEDDETAANLLALCLTILLGMCALFGVAIWLLRDEIVTLGKEPRIREYLWLIPVSLLGAGFYQTMNYWAMRRKAFKRIAQTKVNQGIGLALTQVLMGLLKLGPLGLLVGDFVGRAGGGTTLASLAWQQDREALRGITTARMKAVARTYAKFPLYSVGTAILNSFSLYLPGLLLPAFFNMTVSGHYYWAQRVLTLPIALISASFTMVFYQRAADCYNARGDLRGLVLKSYKSLLAVMIIPGILLLVFAPWLFRVVLGEEYGVAGEYLRLILPWMALVFVVQPSSGVLPIINRQDVRMVYEVVPFLLRIGGFAAGVYYFKSPVYAIGLYGLVGFLANLGLALTVLHYAGKEVKA